METLKRGGEGEKELRWEMGKRLRGESCKVGLTEVRGFGELSWTNFEGWKLKRIVNWPLF
ncbi:MAG: hypothetical protein ACTS4U_00975 [Candidatus Hodgkinia cicadicola]